MSSGPSSLLHDLPTADQLKNEHQITLIDRTEEGREESERQRSEPSTGATTPQNEPGLRKRLTHQSSNIQEAFRKEVNRKKYSRYAQGRYATGDDGAAASNQPSVEHVESATDADGATIQKSYLERAQGKARGLLNRKKYMGHGKHEKDTIVDILYENQRGAFLFGIPKYSSSSLLPTDPRPWQNADFRTSPVDIRNAQVPDPSWEWVWKSWYVDMSRDVDEEGWEYSFAFVGHGGRTFAWHGTHPWFHSFVRRRRWLRMRRRRFVPQSQDKSHALNADYFTIHTKNLRPRSITESRVPSSAANVLARFREQELAVEDMEIDNIADLFLALRRASVDRQKIAAVRKFLEEGGEELFYLGERMEEIMHTFMFQTSRKQLLQFLTECHNRTHEQLDDLSSHNHENDDDDRQAQHDRRVRQADNLDKAVHAAKESIQNLEYWSDTKDMSSTHRPGADEEGHPEPSFKNKQSADERGQPLHSHPINDTPRSQDVSHTRCEPSDEPDPKTTESNSDSAARSKKDTEWFDAESKVSEDPDREQDGTSDERYVTAAESSSEIDGKGDRWKSRGKMPASHLDGVDEDDECIPDTHGHSTIVEGDTLEELVPESENS